MVAIGKEMVFLGKKILQGKIQGISLQVREKWNFKSTYFFSLHLYCL